MLGKLINGALVEPSENERKKIVIANPTDEMLKFVMGYKEVTFEAEPEYDIEKQSLTPVYTETEDAITVSWEVGERSEEE